MSRPKLHTAHNLVTPPALTHTHRDEPSGVYEPPSDKALEQFVEMVCRELVEQGHQKYASKEVQWGITQLLKLVTELTYKRLNQR